jgi:hypothetical protein
LLDEALSATRRRRALEEISIRSAITVPLSSGRGTSAC